MKMTDLQIAQKLVNLNMSAQTRNIFFNLSIKSVRRLMNCKKCYYIGVTFEEHGPNERSIDRVDNNKGYIDDNVVACTRYINGLKSNLTVKDIESIAKGIKKKLNNY